jgi:hypothetical protein
VKNDTLLVMTTSDGRLLVTGSDDTLSVMTSSRPTRAGDDKLLEMTSDDTLSVMISCDKILVTSSDGTR